MQDYSALEKMLVLINVILFGASLSAENVDQEVSTALLYIMFAIAYYVTTSSCLFGASSLKRRFAARQDCTAAFYPAIPARVFLPTT